MEQPSARFIANSCYYETQDPDDYFVYSGQIDFSGGTGSLSLPYGTTAQRTAAVDGRVRFNSTTARYEVSSGSSWTELPLNGGENGVISLSSNNGSVSWDLSQGTRVYTLLLTQDTSLAAPANFVAGAEHTLVVMQDATGGHKLTFDGSYALDWRGVNAPTTLTNANSVAVLKVTSAGAGYYAALQFVTPADLSWSDFERLSTLSVDGSGKIAWPMATRLAEVTLTGAATLSAPTGQVAGREYTLIVKQDSAGGHTLAFDGAYTLADPSAQPDPAAGNATVFKFDCDGSNLYGFSTRKAATANVA